MTTSILAKRTVFLALIIFFCGLFSVGTVSAQDKPFHIENFTLENGMQVVVVPSHRAPVVTQMLMLNVGAADEEWGKSGLAHFFEHLMFKGTERFPAGEFSRRVQAVGGNDNAYTSLDYTVYHQSVPKDYLPMVMEMEADRMHHLVLSDAVIESERKVILEERRERVENSPFGRYNERMNNLLFANHPYNVPTIGWAHEIQALSHEDIKNFYRQWYQPHNALLVLAGDVTLEEAKILTERFYGALDNQAPRVLQSRPTIPALADEASFSMRLDMKDPQIRQHIYRVAYLVPSETVEPDTAMALQLIAEILDGGGAARMNQHFVVRNQLVTFASMAYRTGMKDYGVAMFQYSSDEAVDMAGYHRAFLDDVVKNSLSEAEIKTAKERILTSLAFTRDDATSLAEAVGLSVIMGMSVEDIQNWPKKLEDFPTAKVNETLRRFFANGANTRMIDGYLRPQDTEHHDQGGGKP